MGNAVEIERWRGTDGRRLAEALERIPGLTLDDGYRGALTVGPMTAEVRFEPQGWVHVRLPAMPALAATTALGIVHKLPGNVRYARDRSGLMLVAETLLDGMAQLPGCMAEIRAGVAWAVGLSVGEPPRSIDAGEAVQAVPLELLHAELQRLPFGDDGVVRRKGANGAAWELRPRIDDTPVPVLLEAVARGVHLRRVVLERIPAAAALAVADQALRLNATTRFCRLARAGEAVVAEAVLRPDLVGAEWLTAAARAVAVTSRRAWGPLDVLARHPHVAQTYAAMFCDASLTAAWADLPGEELTLTPTR